MKRLIVSVLAVCFGVSLAFGASSNANPRALDASMDHFRANARAYGLTDPDHELVQRSARTDEVGLTHVRYDQYVRGVKVFEGEAISHVDARGDVTVTNAIRGNLRVDTTPSISEATAVGTAVSAIAPRGGYTPASRLEILPRGEHTGRTQLVWHVTLHVDNNVDEASQWEYFVNAHDGSVALAFNALPTGDTAGTANTMYVGTQPIRVDLVGSTYYLRDLTRSGNYTVDLNNGTSGSTVMSNSSSTFGTGVKTNSTGGTGADRLTAGGEAHFGMQATWDYFQNAHGRNGIDDAGTTTFSRVHYSSSYQNAFWSNSCFCMTYGDGGTTFYPLTSIDVAGHEMAHGVMSREAALTYSGESGGLNESSSDIFGTMVEWAVNSSADVPDWWIGERIYKSNYGSNGNYTQTKAARYMDDPKKDGTSPACWSKTLKRLDVHYSSGPNNHMFYLLANGGTSKCNGKSVAGVGRDVAARIWYKAVADYMTSSTNYAGARAACLSAATALYGSGSTQYKAVAAAFSAIKVN